MSAPKKIILDGAGLTINDLVGVVREGWLVEIDPARLQEIAEVRQYIDALLSG